MQITREDLNPCTVSLSIVCDPAQVKTGFEKAFKQIAKNIRLPGFRPGHAPKAMVEGLIQKEELFDAAAEHIVRISYREALESEKLDPDVSTRPTVELKLLDDKTEAAEYTIKVPLRPKVTLGDYKGLPVEKPAITVSDDEIDRQINEFRSKRQLREAITDRGVQEGDVAVVNVRIEGEAGDGRNFMTIAGQTFAQLDEALMGMRVEDMKNLEVTFPENFQEKDWAGNSYKIQITLNSLSGIKLPDLDDSFAQSMKTENVEDLRLRVRDVIGRAKEQMLREMVTEQLLDKLHERSQVQVSDNMWEALAEQRIRETTDEQAKANKTLEMYSAEQGMTVEQFREAWRDRARLQIERAMLINAVFEAEGMEISNAGLNEELHEMAQEYGIGPEEMLNTLRTNDAINELHFRAISRMVANFLDQHADVKQVASV